MPLLTFISLLVLTLGHLTSSSEPWVKTWLDLINSERLGLPCLTEANEHTQKVSSDDPFKDDEFERMSLYYATIGDLETEALPKLVDELINFSNSANDEQEYEYTMNVKVTIEGDPDSYREYLCADTAIDEGVDGEILFCLTNDLPRQKEVVIKVMGKAKYDEESKIYDLLEDNPAILFIEVKGILSGDCDWIEGKFGIVEEKFETCLEKLHRFCNQKFSGSALVVLGNQLVNAYESIHSEKVVHADVKADNLIYSGDSSEEFPIKIINFASSVKHGYEAQYLRGNLPNMSKRSEVVKPYTVYLADDLEGLDSLLAKFYFGKLPWDDKVMSTHSAGMKLEEAYRLEADAEEIRRLTTDLAECAQSLKEAKETLGPHIFAGFQGFNEFTQEVYNLDPEVMPDYELLRGKLNDVDVSQVSNASPEMDWIRRPKALLKGQNISTAKIACKTSENLHEFTITFEPYYNPIRYSLLEKYSKVTLSEKLQISKVSSFIVPNEHMANIGNYFKETALSLPSSLYQHIYVNFERTYNARKDEFTVSMVAMGCLEMWDPTSDLTQVIVAANLTQMTTEEVETIKKASGETTNSANIHPIELDRDMQDNVETFKNALQIFTSTKQSVLDEIKSGRYHKWGYSWQVQPDYKALVTFVFC